jgi:hypothetical protein
MKNLAPVYALAIASLFATAACDKKAAAGDAGSPASAAVSAGATATSAGVPAAATSAVAGSVDEMTASCKRVCELTIECATEIAKAAGAPPSFIESSKADAEKGHAACLKMCDDEAGKASDEDRQQLGQLNVCLKKPCAEFISCLDTIK